MTTSSLGATELSRRASNRTLLLWALVAAAVLLIAAAWPVGGSSPSVLSAATADTVSLDMSPAATAGSRELSVPEAAAALGGKTADVEEQAPTF